MRLTETVGTNKTSYVRGETVHMSAHVLSDGVPLSGSAVRFGVRMPNGTETAFNAVTDSNGFARGTFAPGNAVGSYALAAETSSGSQTVTASTNFSVVK